MAHATSFDRRSTSLPLAAQMNDVEALPQMMLQQVANDVMLRINDVALRANGHAFGVISREHLAISPILCYTKVDARTPKR